MPKWNELTKGTRYAIIAAAAAAGVGGAYYMNWIPGYKRKTETKSSESGKK